MKICVVGCGIGGIIALKNLTLDGFDCVAFDQRSTVGGAWAPEVSYHGQKVQVHKKTWEFADDPLPDATPVYVPKEQAYDYLRGITEKYNLVDKIHLLTRVVKFEYVKQNSKPWIVHLKNLMSGETSSQEFHFVVTAHGLFSHPNIPTFPDQDRFRGTIIHSTKWHPHILKKNGPVNVIVVGAGKSGMDVVTDLGFRTGYSEKSNNADVDYAKPHWSLPQGSKATWLCRQWHWPVGQTVHTGTDKFVEDYFYNGFVGLMLPVYYNVGFLWHILHLASRPVAWVFWGALERLLAYQNRLEQLDMVPDNPIDIDVYNSDFLVQKDVYRILADPTTPVSPLRGEIERFAEDGVYLKSGDFMQADTVVLCTGFTKPDFRLPKEMHQKVFKEPPFAEDGVYLYKHILHPDIPSMAYIGMASAFMNPLTMELQSHWLCEYLKGNISVPAYNEMHEIITSRAAHHRSFMPKSPTRSGQVQLQMFYYYAELLQDMGISYNRFGWNILANMFSSRHSEHYRNLRSKL